jgi:hypothetical protein
MFRARHCAKYLGISSHITLTSPLRWILSPPLKRKLGAREIKLLF